MTRARRIAIDLVLLTTVPLTWASGLVLFFAFHVGLGCWRTEALGLSRLAWQDLHRLSALMALAGLLAHLTGHATPLYRRVLRVLRGRLAKHDLHELLFYLGNGVVLVTGFAAWWVLAGSAPLTGPIPLGPLPAGRHPWVDVHNLTALASLYFSVQHIRRRWRALRPRRAPFRTSRGTRFIAVDTRRCQACRSCAEACTHQVLGMVAFLWHRHVRIDNPEACTGCRRCIRICAHGAIRAVELP